MIEEQTDILERILEQYPDLLVVLGDATKDEVLMEANIQHASALITALAGDTANLFVVISARALKPDLAVIARAVDEHTAGKMYKAGATHVISPNLTEGLRMASVVLRPNVVSFLDVATRDQEMAFRLEEVTVPPEPAYQPRSLRELEIPQRTGLIVIAVKKEQNSHTEFIFNPQSSTIIQGGDKLIVLGDIDRVAKLHQLLHDLGRR
ncbi:MAG: TrkA family potassium uptake protein [Calditrichaeota bacterium]|nr:MAG: TrkA family potassium uptake protein [Calditrichota bacterium]